MKAQTICLFLLIMFSDHPLHPICAYLQSPSTNITSNQQISIALQLEQNDQAILHNHLRLYTDNPAITIQFWEPETPPSTDFIQKLKKTTQLYTSDTTLVVTLSETPKPFKLFISCLCINTNSGSIRAQSLTLPIS